jgi:hypothetical protein
LTLSPIRRKNLIRPFLQFVPLFLRKIFLLVLWKNRDQKNWERRAAENVNDPGASTLPHSPPRDSDLPEPAFHDVSGLRIGRQQTHNVGPLLVSEEFAGCGKVAGVSTTVSTIQLYAIGHLSSRIKSVQWQPCIIREFHTGIAVARVGWE